MDSDLNPQNPNLQLPNPQLPQAHPPNPQLPQVQLPNPQPPQSQFPNSQISHPQGSQLIGGSSRENTSIVHSQPINPSGNSLIQSPQSVSQIVRPILPPVQNTHHIDNDTVSEPYITSPGPSVMSVQSYNTSTLTMDTVPILTNIGTINTFRGLPNEDIREWLTQFNWIADVNQWPEDIRCALLPGYLEGVAKTWYSTVPLADRGNYKIIQEQLLQSFQQMVSSVQLLNQLLSRQQLDDELVETYAFSKLKLCEDLNRNMTEIDRVTYLIQGMKPQLCSYLVDKKPTTIIKTMLLAREKQNNLNLNMELKTAISNEITTIPTHLNRTTTSLSNITNESNPVKLVTPTSPNSSIVAEFRDVMTQLKEELKEVNKSQIEAIQKLETTQNKTNANPTNNFGSHNTTYAPQRLHQWTSDDRSICKKCSKVGHIAGM